MNKILNVQSDSENKESNSSASLFSLGFRPFFLAAGLFAVLTISWWAAVFHFQLTLSVQSISPSQWHAHEMIYGYSLAVIAGFLLTAVKNWTGIQTLSGKSLFMLFGLWTATRFLFLYGDTYILLAGVTDLLFSLLLVFYVAAPIFKVKQWKQISILSKLVLLLVANLLFYAGVLFGLDSGVYLGLYGGLYLVIGLILTMARRVVPFFIEAGVGYPFKAKNYRWIDISNLILFLGFFISELFLHNPAITAYLALILFALNTIRLIGWHTVGIWRKSLLWSLYLALWFINLGFLLYAGVHFFAIAKSLAIHAFSFGGIGLITLAMMSRVALGHTGRSVFDPPKVMSYAFGCLVLAAIIRVIFPILDVGHYSIWIGLSQILWVLSFAIFSFVYFPMLTRPRVDGKPG